MTTMPGVGDVWNVIKLCQHLLDSLSCRYEISALIPLLGGEQELQFRLVRRRFLDVFAFAPINGFTSYFAERTTIVDAVGPDYFSPYGAKIAPLRNMRVKKLIMAHGLLEHGCVRKYTITPEQPGSTTLARFVNYLSYSQPTLWLTSVTYLVAFQLIAICTTSTKTTWIGLYNILLSIVWSICVRLVDRITLIPIVHTPAKPNAPDAAVFMGLRNSALILKGTRTDIERWTGVGLEFRKASWVPWLVCFSQAGTVGMLAFSLLTIPLGTGQDQLLFIAINILGQVNTWVGQWLHAKQSIKKLTLESIEITRTRTHVYAELILEFGRGRWIDAVGLIPASRSWEIWRAKVHEGPDGLPRRGADPKDLWDELDYKYNSMDSAATIPTTQAVQVRKDDFKG